MQARMRLEIRSEVSCLPNVRVTEDSLEPAVLSFVR